MSLDYRVNHIYTWSYQRHRRPRPLVQRLLSRRYALLALLPVLLLAIYLALPFELPHVGQAITGNADGIHFIMQVDSDCSPFTALGHCISISPAGPPA